MGASCQILPCTPTTGALPCSSMAHCASFPRAHPCNLLCPALAFTFPCPAVQPALPLTSLCPYRICQMCPLQLLVDITVASLKHDSHPAPHPAQHIAVSSIILACTLHPLIASSGSVSLTAQHMSARQLHFPGTCIQMDMHTCTNNLLGIQDTILSGRAEGHSSMGAGAGAGHSPRASPSGCFSSPGGCSVSAQLGTSKVICLRTDEV